MSTVLTDRSPLVQGLGIDARVLDEAMARVTSADWDAWEAQVRRTGACVRPQRLKGCIHDRDGNVVLDTATMPDGVLYTACKTRRVALCPSCAWLYAGDVFRVVREGMAMPDSTAPAEHPMVFATFTGPSFGHVHGFKDGNLCRQSHGKPKLCKHSRPTWCTRRHGPEDAELGEPLCVDCYDYTAAVLFNWWAPELWRRFRIYLDRHLADRKGIKRKVFDKTVRVSFVKVAEFQKRGSVHYHGILRLDAKSEGIEPPPFGFTTADLAAAVEAAARSVRLVVPTGTARDLVLTFGGQLDVEPLAGNAEDLERQGRRAGYLAKYAVKGAEDFGVGPLPLTAANARYLGLSDHVVRMIGTCERLANLPGHHLLHRWTHMLGYRGHFLTKSRRYSTTLGALRQARAIHQRRTAREARGLPPEDDHEDTGEISNLAYDGTGYTTTGDLLLARSIAAWTRENRQLARLETRTAA